MKVSGDLVGSGTLVRFAVAKVGVGVLVDFARAFVATSGLSRCLPCLTGKVSIGVVGAELSAAAFGVRLTLLDEDMLQKVRHSALSVSQRITKSHLSKVCYVYTRDLHGSITHAIKVCRMQTWFSQSFISFLTSSGWQAS